MHQRISQEGGKNPQKGWKKILANHIFDKGVIPRILEELL